MHGGAGLALLAETIGAATTRATELGGEAATLAAQLQAVVERIGVVTAQVWGSGDVELSLANATAYLEAVGHTVLGWIWLEQWLTADGREGDFYDGKRQAARYFFAHELPRTGPQLDLLASLDRTTLDMQDAWF
jgi:hypothetical protein